MGPIKLIRLLPAKLRRNYFSIVLFRSLTSVLDVLSIALIGLVAAAVSNQSGGKKVVFLGLDVSNLTENTLLFSVFSIFGLFVMKGFFAAYLSFKLSMVLSEIEAITAENVALTLLTKNFVGLRAKSKSQLEWSIFQSSHHASTTQLAALAQLVSDGVVLIFIGTLLFVVDPSATFFVVIYFSIVGFVLQRLIGKSLRGTAIQVEQATKATNLRIQDFADSFKEIFVLGIHAYYIERISESRKRLADGLAHQRFYYGLPRFVLETALMLGIMGFVSWQFFSGTLADALPVIGVFMAGGLRVMSSAIPIQTSISALRSSQSEGQEAFEALSNIPKLEVKVLNHTRDDSKKLRTPGPISVSVNNVSFAYPDSDIFSVNNVEFDVTCGELTAIIGPSGSGKTTVADLVLGLLNPSRGDVSLLDQNGNLLDRDCSRISYVPQKPGIISASIAENVALGIPMHEIDSDLVWDSLEGAQLSDDVRKMPAKLQTLIGPGNQQLSGGQVQRLGIARALYEKSGLIVLDEATSALDAGVEAQISNVINGIKNKITVLVIAHRLSTIQFADKVILFEAGELKGQGTFNQLREKHELLESYVKLMRIED